MLLDEADGRYWRVNSTTVLLLEVLDQGGDAEQAARRIADSFDIDEETALADAREAIERLHVLGLLT